MSRRRKVNPVFYAIAAALVVLALIWVGKTFFKAPSAKITQNNTAKTGTNGDIMAPVPLLNTNRNSSIATTPTEPTTVSVLSTSLASSAITILTSPLSSAMATNVTSPVEIVTNGFPRPIENIFEAQLALAERGISCGIIDGVMGGQTRAALKAFQSQQGLPETGQLNAETKAKLILTKPACTYYTVSSNDLSRVQSLGTNWLAKSQQKELGYENVLELLVEKTFSGSNKIRALNPGVSWTNVASGTVMVIPNVQKPGVRQKASFIRIQLQEKTLQAFDENTNLLAHFPCSIAQRVEKRPVGELTVVNAAKNPNYTFDPENFPESAEAQQLGRKLILPPGPNSPVGTVWIGLDKPGYGIHGTPKPEEVGRTESHGCFRLANWNAEYLLRLVSIGTPVYVEP